jgi:AcrR family transcriptional regulator
MARKPAPSRPHEEHDARDRIVAALMELLAEKALEQISLGDVARAAGVTLAQLRGAFPSVPSIIGAQMKRTDQTVLASDLSDMAEEAPREKLFDVLMRRLEALTPHKAAMKSLLRSIARNPGLAMALNGPAVNSMQYMLAAAEIENAGPKGLVRAQGLALLFGRVLWVWVDDEDPGLARTMAALDRELARGGRWIGVLDRLFGIPEALCRGRSRFRSRHRRRDGTDDETVAA